MRAITPLTLLIVTLVVPASVAAQPPLQNSIQNAVQEAVQTQEETDTEDEGGGPNWLSIGLLGAGIATWFAGSECGLSGPTTDEFFLGFDRTVVTYEPVSGDSCQVGGTAETYFLGELAGTERLTPQDSYGNFSSDEYTVGKTYTRTPYVIAGLAMVGTAAVMAFLGGDDAPEAVQDIHVAALPGGGVRATRTFGW